MNFGEKEDFLERHKYFFYDFYFKFEGLSLQKQKELVNTVQKLGGVVSNDADFTLCESSYYKNLKRKSNTDYYAVKYINDCIANNKLLDINEYKFHDDEEDIATVDQCIINNNTILNEEVKEKPHKEINENTETRTKIQKNSFLKKEIRNISVSNWRKIKPTIKRKQEKEIASIETKKKVTEVIDLSSDESDEGPVKSNVCLKNLKILDPLSINTKFSSNQRKAGEKDQKNLLMKSSEEARSSQKATKKKTTVTEYIELFEEVIEDQAAPVTLPSSPPGSPSALRSASESSSSSDEDNDDDNDNTNVDDVDDANNDDDNNDDHNKDGIVLSYNYKWWQKLPRPSSTVYNKYVKRSGRGATFSESEQRVMITFLIKHKLISGYSGASRVPWEEMHRKGYLLHRTVESLSNHYRRSILPNIKNFKLPKKYEKQFLLTRR